MLFGNKLSMRLIGIAGATASGKTTISKGLIEHFKADTNRFSKILAAIAEGADLPTDKESLQKLSTALRATLGESVLAYGMSEWVKQSKAEAIVVEGLRRKTDIELLAKAAEATGREWLLLFIDAPFETRFERFKSREGNATLEEFKELDEQECEQELPLIKPDAHLILENASAPPGEVIARAITFIEKE